MEREVAPSTGLGLVRFAGMVEALRRVNKTHKDDETSGLALPLPAHAFVRTRLTIDLPSHLAIALWALNAIPTRRHYGDGTE